jgi:26S proteasome non-ATPase regulatory subunit 9
MSSTQSNSTRTPAQERALLLMAERDLVDQQLRVHIAILSSHGADMSTRLVDAQGFPRADIDIVAVRTARVRVIELRNDRARLTDAIAQALADVHSSTSQLSHAVKINGSSDTPGLSRTSTPEAGPPRVLVPFARVDGVAPGSPAQQAVRIGTQPDNLLKVSDCAKHVQGLQREDLILAFGGLTAQSFLNSSLQPLAQLVTSHENVKLINLISCT